jgi:hypothetical protein
MRSQVVIENTGAMIVRKVINIGIALSLGGAALFSDAGYAADSHGTPAPAATSTTPNGANNNTAGGSSATDTTLVAGKSLSVSDLHIGTACDPNTGAISGDISTRQVASEGTTITVYFDKNKLSDAKLVEKERQTRLYSDVQTVLGGVLAVAPCDQERKTLDLKFKRATVTITGVDQQGKDAQSVTVITGPPEHLYLGFDLAVNSLKTLKYDTASKSLQPASTSPQLYLSLNWLIGDVLSRAQTKLLYDNISVKALISADSTPLNSFGAGLGYRFPELSWGSFDLSALSVFGGYFWTKQDSTKNGVVQTNGGTSRAWRVGVTYDVSTMVKSVKW